MTKFWQAPNGKIMASAEYLGGLKWRVFMTMPRVTLTCTVNVSRSRPTVEDYECQRNTAPKDESREAEVAVCRAAVRFACGK